MTGGPDFGISLGTLKSRTLPPLAAEHRHALCGIDRTAAADRDEAVEVAIAEETSPCYDHGRRRVGNGIGKDRPGYPRAVEKRRRPVDNTAAADKRISGDERLFEAEPPQHRGQFSESAAPHGHKPRRGYNRRPSDLPRRTEQLPSHWLFKAEAQHPVRLLGELQQVAACGPAEMRKILNRPRIGREHFENSTWRQGFQRPPRLQYRQRTQQPGRVEDGYGIRRLHGDRQSVSWTRYLQGLRGIGKQTAPSAHPDSGLRLSERGAHKRKWPGLKSRPSLNREASRLGDVRVRRPSFRAQVPEILIGGIGHRKLAAIEDRVIGMWRKMPAVTTGIFFWLVCKKRNALRTRGGTCYASVSATFS